MRVTPPPCRCEADGAALPHVLPRRSQARCPRRRTSCPAARRRSSRREEPVAAADRRAPADDHMGPSTVPAPMRTRAPTMLYGPTSTSSASSDVRSTSAVEWILGTTKLPWPCAARTSVPLHRPVRHRQRAAGELADAALDPIHRGLEEQLVARFDRALEAGAIDAGKEKQRPSGTTSSWSRR